MRLPDFEIERYFAQYEFQTPHLLCTSDCESLSIGELCALEPGGLEGLAQLGLGYTEAPGHPELRRRIAELYEGLDPDQVLVTTGGVEAILLAATALIAPGDHVLVVEPAYQCLAEIARGLGAEVEGWPLLAEEAWQASLERLESLLRPETKAVVVNFPHNPTGAHPSRETWQQLVHLLDQRDVVLMADEAYRYSEYVAEHRLPAACELQASAVSLGLLSKSFGLPGLRVGWIASQDSELLSSAQAAKDYTTICGSAPSEYLAGLALQHRDVLLARSSGIVRENLQILRSFMARQQELLEWTEPAAGPVCFPRLRSGGEQAVEQLCREAREQAGVLLLPGRVFARPEHLRIGFGRRDFAQCLERFEPVLARWAPSRS